MTSCSSPTGSLAARLFPELPSLQGWVEAMTSLGRLIFFDQPGTGASDPVTAGALPTLEQWSDSITAVLDDLGSSEAVLLAIDGASRRRRCSQQHIRPAQRRWSCSKATQMRATAPSWLERKLSLRWTPCGGRESSSMSINPDMPWNEEIRAAWARHDRLAASPGTVALMMPLVIELNVREILPDRPRAHPCRPARRRPIHHTRNGQGCRRSHTGREIR